MMVYGGICIFMLNVFTKKTRISFNKSQSSQSGGYPLPRNIAGFPQGCHHPTRGGMPSSQCHFAAIATHEVAQSWLPLGYEIAFQVPDTKSDMEWSLIRSKGTVSPFHVDSSGLGITLIVLEGNKYWIVMTQMGEHDTICSVDTLGPGWKLNLEPIRSEERRVGKECSS